MADSPSQIGVYRSTRSNSIPKELTERVRWICWRYDDRGKKPPVDPWTGKAFDSRDSSRWLSHETATATAQERGYDGIVFVHTPDDPFSFIDLDDAIDGKTGKIEPWAMEIVEQIDLYTEISPSGRGLRIAVRGKLPVGKKGTKPTELFCGAGYVTITSNTLPGYEAIHESLLASVGFRSLSPYSLTPASASTNSLI